MISSAGVAECEWILSLPIFRLGLKLFYFPYSKNAELVMSRENPAIGFPTRSESNYLNKKNKGAI